MAEALPCACEYVLIRIAPDPIRNEFVNIGVALYDPRVGGFAGVRISPDLRRARQLSPAFEEGDLAGLEADLLLRLQTQAPAWSSREYFLQLSQESFSHALQLSPPTLVLTRDPAAELDRLYRDYAAPPPEAARSLATGARRVVLRHLQRVFAEERVLARLERNARPGAWLQEPDSFCFDFHYFPENDVRHVIQALPLASGEGEIKEFCFTVERLRRRLGGFDVASFTDTETVAETDTEADAPADSVRQYHRSLLASAGVRVLTLLQAPAEAARIRAALGLG